MDVFQIVDIVFSPTLVKPFAVGFSLGCIAGWMASSFAFKQKIESLEYAISKGKELIQNSDEQLAQEKANTHQARHEADELKKRIPAGMVCGACSERVQFTGRDKEHGYYNYNFVCINAECGTPLALSEPQFRALSIAINSR
jgi:hypothetical protein